MSKEMPPEQVTDEMLRAAGYDPNGLDRGKGGRQAIAAAINASGCVLVPRQVLEAFMREMPGDDDGDGNAPGHAHEVPGVWDDDNRPEIAGKQCAWCATWNSMKAMLAAAETPAAASSEREADHD